MTIKAFQKLIWDFYKGHKRDLPWRHTADPYKIMVSEVMLQQTQVARGLVKYPEFIKRFPTVQSLAKASLTDVLQTWRGLGYNRRALMLHRAAKIIVKDWRGRFLRDSEKWDSLPGIGPNTAGSICVYAFNLPVVFIETNIRKIYIHHFFHDQDNIADTEIMPLIETSLDQKRPREWHWALMDYGAFLAKSVPNPNRKSKHYTRQSKFEGSFRQLRAQILNLATAGPVSPARIVKQTGRSREEVGRALASLASEGFLVNYKKGYKLV
jgi:A/G-specific adenine glycosylase